MDSEYIVYVVDPETKEEVNALDLGEEHLLFTEFEAMEMAKRLEQKYNCGVYVVKKIRGGYYDRLSYRVVYDSREK